MRFLISLSLKYIRRQKLRSSLTFLCITLSVFILNAFGAMLSSMLATLRADEILQNGSWEVNVQPIMNAVAMRDGKTEQEAGKFISDLPVVSDYLYCNNMRLEAVQVRNTENAVGYFEIQIDDRQPHRFDDLRMYQSGGNSELLGGQSYYADGAAIQILQENEAILPDWVQEMGYEVGDTVTLTCTPVYAILSDDIPQVQATRQLLAEKNDNDEGVFYVVSDDPDGGEKYDPTQFNDIYQKHLLGYIKESYSLDEIEFRDTQKGEPASVTVTIAGFAYGVLESGQFDLTIEWGLGNLAENIYTANTALNEQWEEQSSISSEYSYPFMNYYGSNERLIRIADHIPFEDGLIELLRALNVEDPELYSYHFVPSLLHGDLLALELKSFDVSNGSEFMLGCGLAAVVLIIIWAFGRFVIDNAFEISVQERSVQFASLRVMGASKRQLTALVFTEATAYALTAVPIGTLTAVGPCKLLMTAMRGAGMRVFTFEMNPWLLLLAIVLSLAAIYISAYTSAIYSSRKMTLTEAMQFGKPKTSKTRKASRVNLSDKAFIRRYTWKNIMRTKRRFLISSIAMILGVALSTICLIFVIFIALLCVVQGLFLAYGNAHDFWLDSTSTSISGYNRLVEYFDDNKNYSHYVIRGGDSAYITDDSQALLLRMLQEDPEVGYLSVYVMHESMYTQYLEPLTGMTYAQWCDSKKALVVEDCYPHGNYDEKWNPIEPLPAGYQPVSAFTDAENPVVSLISYESESNTDIPLLGYVCPPPECQEQGLYVYGAIVVLPVENYYLYLDDMWCYALATASPHAPYDDIMEEIDALTAGGQVTLTSDDYIYGTGAKKMLVAVLIALFCFAGSVWLAGVLSMVNTLHTSVLNRRGELRMLRAVGCSIKQMKKMLVLEGVLFSSFSTLIGLLLGAWFATKFEILLDELEVVGTGIVILVVAAILFGVNQLIAVLCAKPGIKALKQEVR